MKKQENDGFTCQNCGEKVAPQTNGSYRNHCPFCLYSLHIDINPGDRQSDCLGLMRPSAVDYNTQKGWQIRHICEKCGFARNNLVADSGEQPDDFELVLKIITDI